MTHPTRTRTSWLSKLFGRGPRKPIRNAPRRLLGVESLEDRVVPVTQIDVGGLRFLASTDFDFDSTTGKYGLYEPGQTVSVGFVPGEGQMFTSLLRLDVEKGDDSSETPGRVTITPSAMTFATSGVTSINLVVVGGSQAVPIPIWQQKNNVDFQSFDISALTGFGQTLDSFNSEEITVADWVEFQMEGLALSPGDEQTGPRVGMQGKGTISNDNGWNFSSIGFVKDLVVVVGGSDYVWADKDGITVTGFAGELDFSSQGYTIGGYVVRGDVKVGYSDPGDGNKRISIGGGVQLTAPTNESFKLENIGGTIEVSLGSENGAPKFYGLTLAVNGTFTAGGLSVKTIDGFGFSYNFDGPQWEIFGGIDFTIKDKGEVVVLLGTDANPGLVIKDGTLQKFNGTINEDFQLGPVLITTSPSNGLNFSYDRDKGQFEMSGGVGIKVGGDGKQFTIDATLGDATDPGIIYIPSKGGLQQANFGITGSLSVGSLSFSAREAGFRWVQATATTAEKWEIHGAYQINFGAIDASVELGTTANPGIVVDGSGFQLDGLTVDVENVRRGPLNLQDLKVSYKKDGDSYDVDVKVTVGIGSFVVGGEFVVVAGKLDSIELAYFDPEGIAVGDSGVNLISVDATVKNIENPSQIAVVGKVGVVYGETVTMLGQEVNLFHAEGDLTVDADEFILDCTAQLGAYSTDGGRTWQGVLGSGEARLNLNWHTQIYSLHVEADGMMGVFDIAGDLVFAAGREIVLLAEADVVIPTWVPFVGGDKLAGLGFFFEHVFAHGQIPTSTTLAAWLDIDLFTDITVGFEVLIDANGTANWKLIGGSEVAGFRQALQPVDQTWTYSTDLSDVPDGTTSITASVDWSRPLSGINFGTPRLRVQHTVNGQTTTYTEDQFAANGITVIDDARLTSPTSKVIQITNTNTSDPYAPLPGTYTLLVDVDGENGNPFPSFPNPGGPDNLDVRVVAHSTSPIFGNIGDKTPYRVTLPTAAPTKTFPVTVTGNADETYLQKGEVSVSLYRVSSADPFRRPVLIEKVQATQPDPDTSGFTATFQVPIDGLAPNAYTLIAVVNDGVNPPVSTDPSAEFTPSFAVRGTVTNQNGTPITAVPVFLDYNGNFIQDDNEPHGMTGPNGYAFAAEFPSATSWDPVPVGKPFNVVLNTSPSVTPPHNTVTFDGTNTVVAPFTQTAPQGISGVVYDDTNSNGNPAAGQPVGGAVAYLDTNNNGVRDAGEPTAVTDAGGVYAFADLPAGTYNVRVDLTTVGRGVAAPAYVVPAGTPGNEAGPNAGRYTYGMSFATAKPVVITSLGVFDDNGDGLTTTLTAVLYDDTTKVELARLTFTPQNPGTLVGGTRYLDLPKPIILPAGFKGMIVAYGFGATADRAGNAAYLPAGTQPPWTADGGNGRLGFTGGFLANTPNTYPAIADGSGYADPYAAGSFQYRDVPWAASPSSAASYQVTLDASGTDLVEGRNFGLLPPTIFFGQVTGYPLVNGKAQPLAPQSGWAVGLVADRVVLGVDSGGGGGYGFTGDQYVVNGTAVSTATAIDTSGVPGAPAAAVYQTARVGQTADAGNGSFTYTLEGLSPGSDYTVRLHFAEIQYVVAGQRKFNASINGTQVLFDFDVVAVAGGPNTAIARDFPATAGPNGRIVIDFTAGSANLPLVNAVQILAPVRDVRTPAKLAIDSGGAATGNFLADQYVTGGSTAAWWGEVVTTTVWDGAPEPVYHTLRVGDQFTYTLPGFEPGRPYTVRLHFADFGVTGPGQRKFNVDINGHRALTDFDVAAAAGQPWEIGYAYAQFFDAVADKDGRIVIDFTKGSANVPNVSGIEVFEPSNVVDTTTTDVQGNYALVAYGAGQYTVIQQPPAGWEQVSPRYGNPIFSPTTPNVSGATAPVYSNYNAMATADFNGDGRMDLAVASLAPRDASWLTLIVTVLYNQPDGSYTAEQFQNIAFNIKAPLLTVGDFNGDHRPDLAVLHSGLLDNGVRTGTYLYAILNTGSPTDPFNQFQSLVKLQPGDVNPGAGEFYSAIASGDIDGDGSDDVLLGLSRAQGQAATLVHLSKIASPTPGLGTMNPTPGGWRPNYAINEIAIADVDDNGYADFLVTSVQTPQSLHPLPYGTGISVLLVGRRKDANDWLDFRNYNDAYGPVTGLAVGPSRISGLPDWYTASPVWLYEDVYLDRPPTSAGNIPIYQAGVNNGDGTFGNLPPSWNFLESRPKDPGANFHLVSGLRMADMNGDSLLDLMYLSSPTPSTQSIAIRLNTGNGFDLTAPPSVLVPLPSNLGSPVEGFVVADFDGDGLNDIFVAGVGPSPGLLFRNGTPQNQPGVSLFAPTGSWRTGLDFLSVQQPTSSAVHGQVFEDVFGDGTRHTGDAALPGAVVFADLNGNRRLDPGEPRATTSPTGHYVLHGLADGTYPVGVVPHPDWKTTTTTDEFTEVTISGGSVARADFGRARRLIGAVDSQTVRTGGTLDLTVPLTPAAAGRRLVYSMEGNIPTGMAIDATTGKVAWSPTAADTGLHAVTVRVRDPFDTRATDTREVTVAVSRPVPTPLIAVGGAGRVRVFSADGTPRFNVAPFGAAYRGGVRVATGDVTGDGVDDVVAVRGAGGPRVVVFDGATGEKIATALPFGPSYRGGLFVAAGDVDGDGWADLIVGRGGGYGPRVRVLSGHDMAVLKDFLAFAPSFRGGVRVAAGDLTGDGAADVVVAAGAGGVPRVKVFDGETGAEVASFRAYAEGFTGGVFVAAGDATGNGRADIVTNFALGGPRVRVFDGTGVTAGNPRATVTDLRTGPAGGPVRVTVKPAHDEQPAALVVGAGDRGRVTVYRLPIAPAGPPARLFDLDLLAASYGVFVG